MDFEYVVAHKMALYNMTMYYYYHWLIECQFQITFVFIISIMILLIFSYLLLLSVLGACNRQYDSGSRIWFDYEIVLEFSWWERFLNPDLSVACTACICTYFIYHIRFYTNSIRCFDHLLLGAVRSCIECHLWFYQNISAYTCRSLQYYFWFGWYSL